jgi:hypothetical protein
VETGSSEPSAEAGLSNDDQVDKSGADVRKRCRTLIRAIRELLVHQGGDPKSVRGILGEFQRLRRVHRQREHSRLSDKDYARFSAEGARQSRRQHKRGRLSEDELLHHRPVLLRARGRWHAPTDDALWISKDGSPCSEKTFANIIRKHTSGPDRLALSPHLFRSCAATSVAVAAPGSVDIIPAILGHGSPRTGERYYNLASSLEASRAHSRMLQSLRRELARGRGHVRVDEGQRLERGARHISARKLP